MWNALSAKCGKSNVTVSAESHDRRGPTSPLQTPSAAGVRSNRSELRAGRHPAIGGRGRYHFDVGGPADPPEHFSGIVVDINLRAPESVQLVRNRLRAEAYRSVPRLFVLAEALHHGSMQAWALGATDTISRPFDARRRSCSASMRRFPTPSGSDATAGGKALNRGVAAAHEVMVEDIQKASRREPR